MSSIENAIENIGKYVIWKHGTGVVAPHRIQGVYIDMDKLPRYDLDLCSPVINHHAIKEIITEEELFERNAKLKGEK